MVGSRHAPRAHHQRCRGRARAGGRARRPASTTVDYGPISHRASRRVGAASTSLKLPLQLGLIANQSGLQSAVKAASNPASSSYGKYPSLSTLQSKYGASSSKRKAVVNAFKSNGITAKVDVTHLRVSATVSVGKAQKMFGTKWKVYKTELGLEGGAAGEHAEAPEGDQRQRRHGRRDAPAAQLRRAARRPRGPPWSPTAGRRRGPGRRRSAACRATFPAALASSSGLYPNQILTAYGIAPLQAAGPQGPGRRGWRSSARRRRRPPTSTRSAPASATQGTALKIHNAGSIKPILESSLDAMTVSMVAPALVALRPVGAPDQRERRRRRRRRLPASCWPSRCRRRRTARRCPHVISVSYGVCESIVAAVHRVAHARRAPAHRHRGARHHDRRRGRRQRLLGVRARRARRTSSRPPTRSRRSPGRRRRRGCWRSAART